MYECAIYLASLLLKVIGLFLMFTLPHKIVTVPIGLHTLLVDSRKCNEAEVIGPIFVKVICYYFKGVDTHSTTIGLFQGHLANTY